MRKTCAPFFFVIALSGCAKTNVDGMGGSDVSQNSSNLSDASWDCEELPPPPPPPPTPVGEYCSEGEERTYPSGQKYCLTFSGSCRGGSIVNSFYGSAGCMQYYAPTWSPDSVQQRCTEWGLTYSKQPCPMQGIVGICTSRNNISRTGGMPYRDQFFYDGIPADTLDKIHQACQIAGDGGGVWGMTPAFTPMVTSSSDEACPRIPEGSDIDAELGDTFGMSDADIIVKAAKILDDKIFGAFLNLKSPIGSCVDEANLIRKRLEDYFLKGPGRHRLRSNRWVFITQQMDWPYEGAHTRAFAYDPTNSKDVVILDPWEYHLGVAGDALSGGTPYRKVAPLDDPKSPFVDHLWHIDPQQSRCEEKPENQVTDGAGKILPKFRPEWLPYK